MKRLLVIIGILCLSLTVIQAQNPGDKALSGYSYNRANLNPDNGNFKPPFKLEVTVPLPVIQDAQTINLFDDYLLVGENGTPGNYTLIDADPFGEAWTRPSPNQPSGNVYNPAYANDMILMTSGTTATASLVAVEASTNTQLWTDNSSSIWDGRSPLILSEMAIYHSSAAVKAVQASSGAVVWSMDVSTAAAPLSVFGDQVYLPKTSSVAALDITSGDVLWETAGVGGDGCQIIPTQRNVFIADPATGTIVALDSYTGMEAWSVGYPGLGSNAIAAAYGNIYVFYNNGTAPAVAALDPADGTDRWMVTDASDSGGTPDYGQVSNNCVYFYNSGSERIRILDAFNGNLLWSISSTGVRDLAMNGEYLFGLRAGDLDIYKPVNLAYLAHMAEGTDPINQNIAITTMFVLANGDDNAVTGTFRLFKSDGTDMEVNLADLEGNGACDTCDPLTPVSEIPVELDPESTLAFASTGESTTLMTGWAELETDGPVSATSIFRTTDTGTILFEAGVGSAAPTGKAVIFITSNDFESVDGVYNSGIIMVNPMDEDADIDVTYTSADGTVTLATTVTLEAGTHAAKFVNTVDGLFPALAGGNLIGTLVLESDIPFVAGGLRTQDGFQMSSYPMAVPQQ